MKDVHILLVEDETIIAMDISSILENFGYIVDEVASSTDEALLYVEKYKPHLVLMDICLDGSKDGTEIVEEIQQKFQIPVIYLSSYSDETTLEKAGSTKPYGYIVKPVDENQLNSTILIALSRFKEDQKKNSGAIIELSKNYSYDLEKDELKHLGSPVKLTKREKKFFSFMIQHVNRVIEYNKIIKNVWRYEEVQVSTLRSLVRRVRDKLEDDILQNISSKGYVLKTLRD
ncbi:response regulator [Sulfurospirillum sp. 1307]|jgi:DNA-binding response OmpR family regulator